MPVSRLVNVAARLAHAAAERPDAKAVVVPAGRGANGRRRYRSITFDELARTSDSIAEGLRAMGVAPGTRLALLVPPGIEFVTLVFAMLKSGAVAILIDPGMGKKNLLACLEEADPQGFVAIPAVQAIARLLGRRFPHARHRLTVGRRWYWSGPTYAQLARKAAQPVLAATAADDPAAIIFTTGSTGPPKGVLYSHGNFDRQVEEIRDFYGIRPGEIDLACFPLFGLFNAALGVTTVVPDMDASRPAQVDPAKIVEAVEDQQVTQSFGSPAIWNRVGAYCTGRGIRMASLARVLSAGAPVPPSVLETMLSCIAPAGDVHTPYGATEALPVSSISAREVLGETRALWQIGRGTCVGRRFPGIEWKVIRTSEGPIAHIRDSEELARGEIGELIVRGPVVTREYVTRREWNARSKIADEGGKWHRMGDVGYLDDTDRFWFCGRAAHRVLTSGGPMHTIPCEAIFNQHPAIFRSALVGVGLAGQQRPVLIAEPHASKMPRSNSERDALIGDLESLALEHEHTRAIRDFLLHPSFPVDIRHNAKIFRERLAVWAAARLPNSNSPKPAPGLPEVAVKR